MLFRNKANRVKGFNKVIVGYSLKSEDSLKSNEEPHLRKTNKVDWKEARIREEFLEKNTDVAKVRGISSWCCF